MPILSFGVISQFKLIADLNYFTLHLHKLFLNILITYSFIHLVIDTFLSFIFDISFILIISIFKYRLYLLKLISWLKLISKIWENQVGSIAYHNFVICSSRSQMTTMNGKRPSSIPSRHQPETQAQHFDLIKYIYDCKYI